MSRTRARVRDIPHAAGLPRERVALAHRGFSGSSGHELENSMSAFDAAASLGYAWVETDVHATADGELLAFHDRSLDRTTDASGVVARMAWSEIAKARIGGTEPIPRLDELFERHPRLKVNIDVKAPEAVMPLIACIERHGAHDRVRIASFSERRRRAVLAGLTRPVRSSPGQELMAALWTASRVRPAAFEPMARRAQIDALQVPERHGRLRVVDERLIRTAHRAGIEVHVWTVNSPADMHRLLDAGVDGIITDRADLLREVLLARGEWTGKTGQTEH